MQASNIVTIPIRSLESNDVVVGLKATRDAITEEFLANLVDYEGGFSYQLPGRILTERAFFEHISDMEGSLAEPLAEVVEAYLSLVGDGYVHHFSDGEKGIGILAYAVTALAMKDTTYLHQVRRYAQTLDRECELWFARVTLPSIILSHGWTDDVIDFTLWVMQMSFYNSLQDYSVVWNKYGMGKAVQKRFTPQQFADRLTQVILGSGYSWNSFDTAIPPGPSSMTPAMPLADTRYPMTDQLGRNLAGKMDDWTKALFELLRPLPGA